MNRGAIFQESEIPSSDGSTEIGIKSVDSVMNLIILVDIVRQNILREVVMDIHTIQHPSRYMIPALSVVARPTYSRDLGTPLISRVDHPVERPTDSEPREGLK